METSIQLLNKRDEKDVLDKIANRISNWRRFGRVIGIEDHHLNNIEENFRMKYERVYRCILHKKQSSEEEVEWFFWRAKLLRLGEGSIVDIIETKYPYLSVAGTTEVHKCVDEDEKLAIISHNASREENFLVLSFDLEDKVELYFNDKIGKSCLVKREKLQDYLFKNHKVLLEFSKYSFSEEKKIECNVLRSAHAWLKSNNDDGFVIKGYDMKHHLKQLTVEFNDESAYRDSFILVYSVKHNLILHVDTDPTDINAAIINNRTNIRYFRTLHQCLIGKAFLFLPVTLLDVTTNINNAPFSCESCEELGLVVPKVNFEKIPLLHEWWQNIERNNREIRQLVNLSKQRENVKRDFLKSIIGFMIGVTSFNYPVSTDNPRFKSSLENEDLKNKLTMIHPNAQDIKTLIEARQ